FKTTQPDDSPRKPVSSLTPIARGSDEADAYTRGSHYGEVVARAENLARELAATPGNVATPSHLAATAERNGREHGLEVTVLDREAMRREGMGAPGRGPGERGGASLHRNRVPGRRRRRGAPRARGEGGYVRHG